MKMTLPAFVILFALPPLAVSGESRVGRSLARLAEDGGTSLIQAQHQVSMGKKCVTTGALRIMRRSRRRKFRKSNLS